ncbi:MAG: chromate efflux transporter, partial [Xanthomonadales bacterium]|nr:chromate efflux transporter [Xanthomonadales bacterium]
RWLVEERRWISEMEFLHALNFCMLLPGPEAQQLATYVGWKLHGIRGGLIAGTLFIIPGAVVVMALTLLYFTWGELAVVRGLFEGLKPAVVIIVLQAMMKIAGRSLRGPVLSGMAVAAFLAMFVFKVPFPLVIAIAALAGALGVREKTPDTTIAHDAQHDRSGRLQPLRLLAMFVALWIGPTALMLAALGPDNVFTQIGIFFSKMAVVTFGGAYAVLAYVSQEAVATFGWLMPGEMIDGLAMAETTPGPLILVTQFVGFAAAFRDAGSLSPIAAGLLGGALTTWVTFVPCFLWIFMGAPYMERLRQNARLSAALKGVTAAVVGVILNLALWFSLHVLFADVRTHEFAGISIQAPVLQSLRVDSMLLTLLAALVMFRFKAGVVTTLALTGGLGVILALVEVAG